MSDENTRDDAPRGPRAPSGDDRPDRPKLGPPVGERTERGPEERPQLGPRREGPRLDGPKGDRGDFRGDRGEFRGDRGDRGDFRGRRDDRPRPPQTVKARLRARARKKARKQRKKMFQRRKVCRFCADKKLAIDYKEPKTLRLFLTETGKVIPRRISGNCAKHQRPLAVAIKRARHIALLPYAAGHM